MRHRQGKMLKVLLVLLAVAGMTTLPAQGWAQSPQEICFDVGTAIDNGDFSNSVLTEDPDNDGLINYWECYGLKEADPAARLNWPGPLTKPGDSNYDPNKELLDPTKANVFFIIKPLDPGSEFPGDPMLMLKDLTKNKTENGLEIVPLLIPDLEVKSNDPIEDRTITLASSTSHGFMSNWTKAIRISESDDTSDIYLWGKCKQGTPLHLDNCTIYTHAIRLGLSEKCAGYNPCELISSDSSFSDFEEMVQETIAKIVAHEGGHTLALSLTCDRKTGICHNKGSGAVMEAFALFKQGTWKIGTDFVSSNIDGFQLHD